LHFYTVFYVQHLNLIYTRETS